MSVLLNQTTAKASTTSENLNLNVQLWLRLRKRKIEGVCMWNNWKLEAGSIHVALALALVLETRPLLVVIHA
jgi:hypothetical protein